MLIKFFVTFCVYKSIWNAHSVNGILGGHDIPIEESPHQVNYGDLCGGVIVDRKWATTSAHCGTGSSFIRIGSRHRLRGSKIKIKKHIVHPYYGKLHTFEYDIQLLELYKSLHFDSEVSALRISKEHNGYINVSGWGYQKEKGDYSDTLQRVQLKIIPFDSCQRVNKFWYNHTLTDRMFCAWSSGKDACQGDSGGGAVSQSGLIGLSSFGYGCGRNIPGVYTNLTENNIRAWVHHYTGV